MLTTLAITGYRSLRDLIVPLGGLNLITGANGTGKSSLYRAMRLLAEIAQGSVVPSLAYEGGLTSTLWAGPEVIAQSVKRGDYPVQGTPRNGPVSLRLGFASDEYGYAIELGLPIPRASAFVRDPEIKRETIWHGSLFRLSTTLVDRHGAVVRFRGDHGKFDIVAQNLMGFDSMMTRLADPRNAPEILTLRDSMRSWRFYDHFRTDADAPARFPQVGTRTPVLSNDGRDLAAAIQTIREMGDEHALNTAIEDAFPGSELSIENIDGRFSLKMRQHGLLRALDASEISDGTLRYLLWVAVLLTPRPPSLMVLNEPETSLHPDLLPALARLIGQASKQTQVVVVSHASGLTAVLGEQASCNAIRLEKQFGETMAMLGRDQPRPRWHWPPG